MPWRPSSAHGHSPVRKKVNVTEVLFIVTFRGALTLVIIEEVELFPRLEPSETFSLSAAIPGNILLLVLATQTSKIPDSSLNLQFAGRIPLMIQRCLLYLPLGLRVCGNCTIQALFGDGLARFQNRRCCVVPMKQIDCSRHEELRRFRCVWALTPFFFALFLKIWVSWRTF